MSDQNYFITFNQSSDLVVLCRPIFNYLMTSFPLSSPRSTTLSAWLEHFIYRLKWLLHNTGGYTVLFNFFLQSQPWPSEWSGWGGRPGGTPSWRRSSWWDLLTPGHSNHLCPGERQDPVGFYSCRDCGGDIQNVWGKEFIQKENFFQSLTTCLINLTRWNQTSFSSINF